MSKEGFSGKRTTGPLWDRALERYHDELDGSQDYETNIEACSLEDLLNHAKNLQQISPRERTTLNSLNRLGPILKFIDDFSAIIAVSFGADAKLTAFVWGSIRLILTLASTAGDTLQDVLGMLEELSLTLPRFRTYEQTLPMESAFEVALLDVYTEVICFYARSIRFFRSHPNIPLLRNAWEEFHGDFSRTLRRIKRFSSTVEGEADLARMRVDKEKYHEVLELMKDLKKPNIKEEEDCIYQHYLIPHDVSPRFLGREQALQAVWNSLNPNENIDSLKTFALYSMGGVGKTQIALRYANQSRKQYDAIFWVSADNTISMARSFRNIAENLGLVTSNEEMQDSVSAMLKVKAWCTNTRFRWLLVFDNADDIELLSHVWPGAALGSILVTSRDFNAAQSPSSAGFHVEPFDEVTGSEVLLRLIGMDPKSQSNQENAKAITQALGGLPLALSQIAGFISQRRLPLSDFLPLYERNSAKIDGRKTSMNNYDHTLNTVWEMSLNRLSGAPSHLQKLLAFCEPDSVDEIILVEGSKSLNDGDFDFLKDEMDLGDAEKVLLQAALIDKNAGDGSLSIHRLMQAAVMRKLSPKARVDYFEVLVRLLSWGFPEFTKKLLGPQFQAWTRCEKCLPHVVHLVKQARKYDILVDDTQRYGDLLAFSNKESAAYASAINLSGLIDLDMNNPAKAVDKLRKALGLRQQLLKPDDPFIASSLSNVSMAYTELGDFERAYATQQEAIDLRLGINSELIGNSYSNMSSLLLRMGKPDQAEEMLGRCPSLKNFTDETFLKTGNPRFSGDMVLLSRIRLRQGRTEDAMRLASKALAFRRKLLGNRFKVCDSLYDVADLLYRQGNSPSAIKLLLELVNTAETLQGAENHLACANYKLSVLHGEMGQQMESQECKSRAIDFRRKVRSWDNEDENEAFEEESFRSLCLWMLW